MLNNLLSLIVFAAALEAMHTKAEKIHPSLKSKLQAGGVANVLVSFNQDAKEILSQFNLQRNNEDRVSHAKKLVTALTDNADKSQSGVIQMLSTRSGGTGTYQYHKRFWTSNRLFVKGADLATVQAIASDANVAKIEEEPILRIEPQRNINSKSEPPGKVWPGWNIKRVKAPEAWAALGGNQGTGVVVGVIDSGVRHTHELLNGKLRQDYSWFDPINGTTQPFDDHGHGSHVTGIIAGGNLDGEDYGVAPGVQFIVCRACTPDGNCPLEFVSACLAFMACPTLPDGSAQDCSKAPRVINVSIGDVHGSEANKADLEAVRAAGLIPVFAMGNDGPNCSTTEPPGEFPFVIGVGATDELDSVYFYSSIGPAYDGGIKPDLVAPGALITSADSVSDGSLLETRGTSNASPHVAGVVALLLVRNPEVTYEQAYSLLTENTSRENITVENKDFCKEQSADTIPNNFFGFGFLNAVKVIEAQTKLLEKV